MKHRKLTGFTLVEVVIAMSIAAVMVVAVQSATQAMTRTARKQTESAAGEARFQRFVEIFRRDLRGWIVVKDGVAPVNSVQPETDRVLLRFPTTADSLTTAIPTTPSQSYAHRSVGDLRYVLRQRGTGLEIVRTELTSGSPPSEITVWRGSDAPQFEFFQANKWIHEWQGKDRPQCMRLTVGTEQIVFAL